MEQMTVKQICKHLHISPGQQSRSTLRWETELSICGKKKKPSKNQYFCKVYSKSEVARIIEFETERRSKPMVRAKRKDAVVVEIKTPDHPFTKPKGDKNREHGYYQRITEYGCMRADLYAK